MTIFLFFGAYLTKAKAPSYAFVGGMIRNVMNSSPRCPISYLLLAFAVREANKANKGTHVLFAYLAGWLISSEHVESFGRKLAFVLSQTTNSARNRTF
jgi:hypothetical protein